QSCADLVERLELARPLRRRFVQAAVFDRDGRLGGEECHELLVFCGEVVPALLLGEIEISVADAAQQDRYPEEAAHRRMIGRKSNRPRVLREVVQPKRPSISDEDAEDASAAGQVADRGMRLRVEAVGDEALELGTAPVD